MGKSKKKHSSDHQSTGSVRRFEAVIFSIIVASLLGYFIYSKANGDAAIDENYLIASIVVFMALMVVSIPRGSPSGPRKRKAPKRGKKPSGPKKTQTKKKVPPSAKSSVVEEIAKEEIAPKERKIISYPGAASGGKYGDAYIPISQEMILKVRSLLAVSCRNCKDLDECWEKHKDDMDYDTFLDSTECHEKMDPDVISAAPPIQVTEEGPAEVEVEVEGDVEVEPEEVVAEEEEVAVDEDSFDDGSWDDSEEDDSGFDESGEEGDFGSDYDEGEEGEAEEGEDDEMAWD